MRKTLLALSLLVLAPTMRAADTKVPTFDQIIELKRPGAVALSPDGSRVAYTVSEANWDENAYETEIYLATASGGEPIQLTRAKKSSTSPDWSPDGKWLAFASDRTDKRQLYLINPAGGEAKAITSVEDGIDGFRWSPDGTKIAFTMSDPKPDAAKERDKKYGEFDGDRQRVPDVSPARHRRGSQRERAGQAEAADERGLHGRQLRLVPRRQVDRLRPPHRSEPHQLSIPPTSRC